MNKTRFVMRHCIISVNSMLGVVLEPFSHHSIQKTTSVKGISKHSCITINAILSHSLCKVNVNVVIHAKLCRKNKQETHENPNIVQG